MDGIFGSAGVWFLIGAILVWFMQAGFAMVETGFTRAKNAGNIIMKNLLDFCLGTIVFVLLGAGLLMGEDALFGLIGVPNLGVFTDFANYDWSSFFFNLVFCATTATIVSGAMAERTKFLSYCIYSLVISAIVYPIEAHWVWGGGWLTQQIAGVYYVDFAGSSLIHMVGGISSFIGALILGPRWGKYLDKDGKPTLERRKAVYVRAIPGHNLTVGALGVFILWFCWYGFNGAAAADMTQLAQILVVTTVATATSTISTMVFTWIKNKKPDVSMTLNGSLAGLVAVTAGCANVDVVGAFFIGLVAGILVDVAVEVIDKKLHVDDPVGAIAVHGANGLWGTLAVGLFSSGINPVTDEAGNVLSQQLGLFYGGGFNMLGVQLLGIVCIAAWTIVCMVALFQILKHTCGVRASRIEEIEGLDKHEHGLPSAYADFVAAPLAAEMIDPEGLAAEEPAGVTVVDTTVPAVKESSAAGAKLSKVVILTKQSKFEDLKQALNAIGVTGLTVTQVLGCGVQKGASEYYRGVKVDMDLLPKVKVEVVVSKVPVEDVVSAARKALYTGHIGDGKIFVYDVEDVVRVRTGESGYDALQDE
ncbi:MAG TPA: ammonium transporter [Candidatus Borkfalkia excrementigallinarum]|uniref:Ammonium transporter n=1 Tax=Candidatus Borkfalkia excrementigallinarum TaxID=2838506 RepID=A0A9D1ZTG1_9FIRM|nr:ammonium transporter [Candidatus Borkfalkia excrementigallinarum]